MDPVALLVAWGLFLAGLIVRALRWQTLLNALGLRRPFSELVGWYFAGSFFNIILPTGFGGDAVRVVELAQDTRRAGAALNSVLVDRYMGIMVLLAMGLVTGLAQPVAAGPVVLLLTGALFAGGLAAAGFLRLAPWGHWRRSQPAGIGALLLRAAGILRLPALSEAVAPYTARAVGGALALSLAFNLLQVGWNVALARGLGLDLPLAVFLVYVPLTAVALLLPAFGGLGVRELSYVNLFAQAGVAPALALALSFSVYLITLAAGLVGGLIYFWQGLRRARSLTGPTTL